MKYLFFDLETTGFGFDKCAIIQLGAIMVDVDNDLKMKPLEAINLKMCPEYGKMIDKRSLEINGYSIEDISKFMPQKEAFNKFIKFLDKHIDRFNKVNKAVLIGYNNQHFDNDFLRQWFYDNGNKFFGAYFWSSSIDVMSEATRYLTSYRPAMLNFKLGTVAKAIGIETDENELHDGLYDVKITFKIFNKIIKSGNFIMPFDEDKAAEMYNQMLIDKAKEVKHISKYTEENAWVQASAELFASF